MSVKKNQDPELIALKEEAVEIGIQFSANIGKEKLQEKIDEATGLRAMQNTAKRESAKREDGGVKLTKPQEMRMKALNLRKVKIVNMARENQGSKTVYASTFNMYLDVARVLPLDKEISVEQCLCDSINEYKQIMDEPIIDKDGNPTGNFKSVQKPMYQVIYLDGKK